MSEPEPPPEAECTSYAIDIRPKFIEEDVEHMRDQVGMDLDDYSTVKDNADLILTRLKDPNDPMPPPPRGPWPQAWITCFEQWIKNGKQP
ncbi:MAG TPA: hypothetical protein VN783_01775 [Thermoanaerobaculia bacterium]|nr:hypothetical protein [Thermoanaerobaculia bacterium]